MAILDIPRVRAKAGPGRFLGLTKKQWTLTTLTFQNSAHILIMHYSRIMPPSGDHRYFTSTAVFLNEVIKLAISLTLAIYETSKTLAPSTPATTMLEQIYNAVFAGDNWKLAVPAAFYTLQNMLQYVAIGNLDAVHFQVLYQLKILITALFSVALLRRPLGSKKWIALIILTFGVSIVSLPQSTTGDSFLLRDVTDHFFPRSLHELGQATPEEAPAAPLYKRSATYEGIANDLPPPDPLMNFSVGVTSVLVAATVSGLAGVYFEKVLKESHNQASVWVRNVQLSMYSLIIALFGGVFWQDGAGIKEHGFFDGYNWVVWSTVILQAAGGLIASMVIRDADNIVKNFATSISIVLSFLFSVWMFDFQVTFTFLLGTSFVLLSTYLYSITERTIHRPPPIKIASFEKPMIERVYTPRNTAGNRATLNPFDLDVALTATSRPSSPMLPRQPSRSNLKREE